MDIARALLAQPASTATSRAQEPRLAMAEIETVRPNNAGKQLAALNLLAPGTNYNGQHRWIFRLSGWAAATPKRLFLLYLPMKHHSTTSPQA